MLILGIFLLVCSGFMFLWFFFIELLDIIPFFRLREGLSNYLGVDLIIHNQFSIAVICLFTGFVFLYAHVENKKEDWEKSILLAIDKDDVLLLSSILKVDLFLLSGKRKLLIKFHLKAEEKGSVLCAKLLLSELK
ncbi:hypothetical protein [Iodobacter sp.]|uniref:hypothetical protein n=1 Tax=Iodobacter sp. TaxID=1915058 RepID=UPI0025FAFA11|nr:hypothetical protein [Iodobacter sp.]